MPRVVPNRLRVVLGTVLVLALAAGAAVVTRAGTGEDKPLPTSVVIDIHYSRFEPSAITVPVGMPIVITLRNHDPIDHEWIVGDDAVHAIHRVGTEPLHPDRPTEVVIPAGSEKTTIVTFAAAGQLKYICHLPGHEAYGMVGTFTIR